MAYVAQNGGRIMRALVEIALSKKWANVSLTLLGMSKAIESGMWPYDHPLKQKQFSLKFEALFGLEKWADDWSISELAESEAQEIGELVHLNARHGLAIVNAAKQFPTVQLHYVLRPLGSDILKIAIQVRVDFIWNVKVHGSSEVFLVWVEDDESSTILQSSYVIFHSTSEFVRTEFIISIPEGEAIPQLIIRSTSGRWLGTDQEVSIPIQSIVMPRASGSHTRKLDLPFLSSSIVNNPVIESIFSHVNYLNGMQSQVYWSLVHSQQHSVLCGPAGSGKSTVAQLALWSAFLTLFDILYRLKRV